MFKIGDYVFDKNNNDRVKIVDISTVWDFVTYKVFNPVTEEVYKLSADAVEAESRQVNASEYYLRYVANGGGGFGIHRRQPAPRGRHLQYG